MQLPTNHAVNCFSSGLCDEIQSVLRMFKRQTIQDAYCLLKFQEATLASISRKTKPILERPLPPPRNVTNSYRINYQSGTRVLRRESSSYFTAFKSHSVEMGNSANFVSSKLRNHEKILSAREIEEKRAKNLCFFCDERYFPGHKCKA